MLESRKRFFVSEVRRNEIVDYDLELISDTLKRWIFYRAILMTSENATLVLDEPDVYAFPPYPKMLGEAIATDKTNQYFITTHNPYFLAALVEKTRANQLGVYVCHRDARGGTQVRMLKPAQVEQVIQLGASTFFNLRELIEA